MTQEDLIAKVQAAIKSDPKKDHVQRISLFGSFLHGDANNHSDVDLLLEPRKNMGYFTLVALQHRIADKIGRQVELRTKAELSKYFRDRVVNEAQTIYEHD